MELERKLAVLGDAAKYDASCAGAGDRGSLLKILLTNECIFDCAYCVSRRGNDLPRERFTPEEIARLTMELFRKRQIEGLFLSSGVMVSPDHTMERMIEAARLLREEHQFPGYIHMKVVPGASAEALALAGRYANRLSANIELPTPADLIQLAPEKTHEAIELSMTRIQEKLLETKDRTRNNGTRPFFAPAGQTTQMIVGATASTDRDILVKSNELYRKYELRRVYYSGFKAVSATTRSAPPARELRLYQADWLMRFYEFDPVELVAGTDGNLVLEQDPKLAWALRHPEFFPVDVNQAPREALLRVPGLGVRNADRIPRLRRFHKVTWDDLTRLRVSARRAGLFLVAAGSPATRKNEPIQLELPGISSDW